MRAAVVVLTLLCVPAVFAYDCFHTPCQNGGTCHNASLELNEPFRCDCFVDYCGTLCESVCPHRVAKATWLVRAAGQGDGQGVEMSGGLTQYNNVPFWTGSSFSDVLGIGNVSLTHTGPAQSSDAFTAAISPAGVAAFVAATEQQCVCVPSTNPTAAGTVLWGTLSRGAVGTVSPGIFASSEMSVGVVVDAARSQLITAGAFDGPSISLAAATANNAVSTGGSNDCYFVAQHKDTGAVQWLRAYGGAGNDAVRDLAISSSDSASASLVAVGTFSRDATFGAWTLPVIHSDVNEQTGEQPYDAFVAWIDPTDGSVLNAVSGGGGGIDFPVAVAVAESSPSGAVVIVGGDSSSSNFTWNGQLLWAEHNTSRTTGFVLALNASGSTVWSHAITGCDDIARITAVATVANGTRVLVAGQYRCVGWSLAGRTAPATLRGDFDMFVMSLNANGGVTWASFGGGNGDDGVTALRIDPFTFAVYLAGAFYSQEFLLPNGVGSDPVLRLTNDVNPVVPSAAYGQNSQALFVKMDDATGRVLWGTSGGGAGNDFAVDIAISHGTGRNGANSAYLAGHFNSGRFVFAGLVIASTGLSDLGSAGDAFVIALDENDDCSPNPCRNGGVCIDLANDFRCECPPDFNTNKVCGYDSCLSSPCHNGGTCHNGVDTYTCTCPTGTLGSICQTNLDDCASQPCHNGGTCVDGINSFTCACPPGLAPPLCLDPDHCLSRPCANGGTCSSFGPSYSCACVPGYGPSSSCVQNIDECASMPCASGATCVDRVNGFTCTCPPLRNGTTCTQELQPPSSTGHSAAHRTASGAVALITATLTAALVAAVVSERWWA